MPRDKRKEEGSELNSYTHTQMSLTLCRTLKVSLESEKLNIEADSDIQSRVHLLDEIFRKRLADASKTPLLILHQVKQILEIKFGASEEMLIHVIFDLSHGRGGVIREVYF